MQYEIDHDILEYGGPSMVPEFNSAGMMFLTIPSLFWDLISFWAGNLPIPRSSVLKHLLRTMHRMMQSSGTSEGLRGLIDTSLVKSIKKIIDNRGLFGSSVLPLGEYHPISTSLQVLTHL